jgi:replicative DNA helicase
MNAVLNAAQQEMRRGRSPIPIPRGRKQPNVHGWQHLVLTEDDLAESFAGNSNLGVLNGAPSANQVDVDLDCAEALQLANRFLPSTNSVFGRRSKPRSHRLYVCDPLPSTAQFRDFDGTMLLEMRSTGTQTLFPPSTHPSGEPITWEQDAGPAAISGDDLTALVRKIAAASILARHWPSEGGRHDAALALAGGLLRLGWDEEQVATFVKAVADAAGDEETRDRAAAASYTGQRLAEGHSATGWKRLGQFVGGEVVNRVLSWLDSIDSGRTEHSAPFREHPIPLAEYPVPRFPTAIFPGWVRAYVEAVAVATQTPPDLGGMLTLSALAAACAKQVRVHITPDWSEPVNLFTVTAMAPAERKSAVFIHMTHPIVEFEAEEVARRTPVVAEADSRRKIAEQVLGRAQREAATATGSERVALLTRADDLARELASILVPAPPQFVVDDCSPERLASLLSEQGGRIAVMAAEGDVFDLMAGRYGATGMTNFGVYLRGHAGDDLRVDRVSRPAEFVRAPALTMGLAVQPEVIHGLAACPGFRGRGLLGRFLYSLPQSLLGRRVSDPPAIPDTVRRTYHRMLTALLRLELNPVTDISGQPEPHRLALSPEAAACFSRFCAELEPRLGELGDLGHISDWAGKLAGAVARIAGLLHMAAYAGQSMPWARPISEATMREAIRLGRDYLIPHAQAAFALMGADPAVADARHLLRVLADRGMDTFTKRDLFQVVKGRFKTVERLERALDVLEEHQYIRKRMEPERPGAGRKPSPTFDVSPLLCCDSTRTRGRPQSAPLDTTGFGGSGYGPAQNAHYAQNSWSERSPADCVDSENCEEPVAQQEMMEWTAEV